MSADTTPEKDPPKDTLELLLRDIHAQLDGRLRRPPPRACARSGDSSIAS